MSLFSAISHFAQDVRQARSRYLTQLQLHALPAEIQKDIGWPADEGVDTNANRQPRRH